MEDKNLETYRNLRIRSICRHIENNKFDIVGKVSLVLNENMQRKNLLSRSAMNFLLGHRFVEFMDKENHLIQSAEVVKYIRINNLMPTVSKILAEKYPNIFTPQRLILSINAAFGYEGRQPKAQIRLNHLYKEKER